MPRCRALPRAPYVLLPRARRGSEVARGSTVDVVVSAAMAAGDERAVAYACVSVVGEWGARCTTTRDEQGRFVVPWPVASAVGTVVRVDSTVTTGDGLRYRRPSVQVTVV